MLKNLLTQLKLELESLKKRTREFETKYFQHHSALPQPDNIEYRPLLRQSNYAKSLIKTLNDMQKQSQL